MELALSSRAQRVQDATGFKQRGAEPLGELAKRFAIADASRLGHAIEIIRWNQLGVHREGDRRRHIELSDLLPHITGDKRDSRSHFRHHPLGFVDTCQAALAEPFVLGNGANPRDVLVDISGDQLAIAALPALQIDKVVVVTTATDTRRDLCTLLSEALVLTACRCEGLLGLPQAHGVLWRAPWTALCGLVTRALRVALPPFELLCGFADGLLGSPLFGGHGPRDRFDEFMLHME